MPALRQVLARRVSPAWFALPLFSLPSTFFWASFVLAYRAGNASLASGLFTCAVAYAGPANVVLHQTGARDYLDKLIDELARGKAMEKILRG